MMTSATQRTPSHAKGKTQRIARRRQRRGARQLNRPLRLESLESRHLLAAEPVSTIFGTFTGDGPSFLGDTAEQATSQDGRFVVFTSEATDFVAPLQDQNGAADVFLYDRLDQSVTLISREVDTLRTSDGASSAPLISDDGRYVAFLSTGTNLVPGQVDGNGGADLFRYDVWFDETILISHLADLPTTTGDQIVLSATMNSDGTAIALESRATNLLTAQETPPAPSLSASGPIHPVHGFPAWYPYNNDGRVAYSPVGPFLTATSGAPAGYVGDPAVTTTVTGSPTGNNFFRIQGPGGIDLQTDLFNVAGKLYSGQALAPAPGDVNGVSDVFLWQDTGFAPAGAIQLVSRTPDAPAQAGNGRSWGPVIDGTGRIVLFNSEATDLVSGQVDGNGGSDVFLFDADSQTTTLVSSSFGSASVTADAPSRVEGIDLFGLVAVLTSEATDLATVYDSDSGLLTPAGVVDLNGAGDVFLLDTETFAVTLVSHTADDAFEAAGAASAEPEISADGRLVVFSSEAPDIVAGVIDNADLRDIFLYDRVSGASQLVSHAAGQPLVPANGDSFSPVVSGAGRVVAFASLATDLVTGLFDVNAASDVFVWDQSLGVMNLASHADPLFDPSLLTSGDGPSYDPVISRNGLSVAFTSDAEDLFWGDFNFVSDVFLYATSPENSAPVLDPLVTAALDLGSALGTAVDAILATPGLYADPDGTTPLGLAIVGQDAANGFWEFSTDGGVQWQPFGITGDLFATLLTADGAGQNRVRFLPHDPSFIGSAGFSFRGWDLSDGNVSGASDVDVSFNGLATAYSAQVATAEGSLVNEPPAVSGFVRFVAQDSVLDFSAADFLANFADPDAGHNLQTVQILSLPSQGTLRLGVDAVTVGQEIGLVDLDDLAYEPQAGFSGADSFSWNASDGTDYAVNPAAVALNVDSADSDVVTQWNQLTLALNPAHGTHMGGRILAMVHAAMYDAVMAFEGTFSPYYVTTPAPAGASVEAAATAAAYQVLYTVYTTPAERAMIQARYDSHLAAIPDGAAETDGIAFGHSVGQAMVMLRADDGAMHAMHEPHPDGTKPGQWRRTASGEPVAPGWGSVTPWLLTSSNQFDQGGPPPLDSQAYFDDYEEVRTWGAVDSTLRDADQTDTVLFWRDHVPAKWYAVARDISQRETLSLAENARLFGLLSLTIADTTISVWDMKYSYNFWRPETAIHLGDSDTNDQTVGDPTWESLIPAPAFPEYVSGHSTTSAAAATLLELYFGRGDYTFELTTMGIPDPRTYDSFMEAAEEAGMSRIYGGIHFPFSNQDGLAAGADLAQYVFGVLGVNTSPSVSDFGVAAEEDVAYVFTVAEFDAAFSDPDALHSLQSVRIISLPANGTLGLLGTPVTVGQEISTADLANLTYLGNLDFHGDDAFSWDGSDGREYSGTPALVNVTVTPVNDPPVLATVGDRLANEGSELTFTAVASDVDLPLDTLTFSLDTASQAAGMTIDAVSGEFRWTPTEPQGGADYAVTITVTDDGTNPGPSSDAETFTITVAVADRDFGDAPDPAYPTLLASEGARHTIVPGVYLGASVDADADGQPDAHALGDDNDGTNDDDGVRWLTRIVPGTTARLEVTASTAGILNAWLDLNADGDWDDVGEHFLVDVPLAAGPNQLSFAVPPTAVVTPSTFARFRFSSQGGLDYRGRAADGEVEDYEVEIQAAVRDDIASRTSSGQWYVATSTGTAFSTTFWGLWGAGVWTDVMSGDFDGDGQADVVGRLDTRWYVGLSTGSSFATTFWGLWGAEAWTDVLIGDFNGDGRDDVAGRLSNRWYVATSTGTSFSTTSWGLWGAGTWSDVRVGDFDGDGKSDIAGRLNGTRWYVAASSGTSFNTTSWGLWGAGAWTDVHVGDFNADGRLDITARLNGNRWYTSLSTGTSFSTTSWGLWGAGTWSDVRVGDFDGDGRSDITGRLNDGRWYVGLSTGASYSTTFWGPWGTSTWSDVGVGDFDGDGRSDVAGRLNDGRWYVARSDGSQFSNEYWGLWDNNLTWLDVLLDDYEP